MVKLSLEQKIGQLFILGFVGSTISDNHPIAEDILKRNLGGVILFDRCIALSTQTNNIISSRQLKSLTSTLQEMADGGLLIAVDQEGGRVSRFSRDRGFPVTPPAAELGSGDLRATVESARQTAEMLHNAGINLNLAPVVDLNTFKDNPIIGKYGRSFSATPSIVADHATAWINEHHLRGVLSCLKHFPGHGSSRTDSHLNFVDITDTWQKNELLPYRHLIKTGLVDAIMLGHLFNRNFDPNYPATLSSAICQSLVRDQLQFKGVVISDDMQMRAITSRYSLEDACCRALAAGVDLLIIGNNLDYDPDILSKITKVILRGFKRGLIPETRIEEAWGRIQKLKTSVSDLNAKQ